MKITIVGAGRVGMHLAKYFADEQQDVFLVDNCSEHLVILESDFNLRTYCGNPTDFEVLRTAQSENADIFVAVTANTSENLVSCAMAKSMGAKKTIARVDSYSFVLPQNEIVLKKMGVDHIVFPDLLAARSILSSLDHSWAKYWSEFENGEIFMVAIQASKLSPISGYKLKDLFAESKKLHISALRRNHRTIIPHGDDSILPGDILYITFIPESQEMVMELSGINEMAVKKVILMGGSTVSELIAELKPPKLSCAIVEKDKERCRELMLNCPDAEIICGDGSEFDVLQEAGIKKCDAFVALTDNTEANILSCLTAADLGVSKNIAEVEKEQLLEKAESFSLHSIVNKPIIAANAIFQLILDANMDSSKCFVLPDAEVGRILVREGSFLTKGKVKDLKLGSELTLAALIRNGHGEMVTGMTQFQSGDVAIVFCLAGSLNRVEKLFGR